MTDNNKRKPACPYADNASSLESKNSVLESGQLVYDITNKKFKIGDGEHRWNELNWFTSEGSISVDTYDKEEIDTLLLDKANKTDVYTKGEVDSYVSGNYTLLMDQIDHKANKTDVYTKAEVDAYVSSDFNILTDRLDLKANKVDVYTKQETDAEVGTKASKSWVEEELNKKRDILSGEVITEIRHLDYDGFDDTKGITTQIETSHGFTPYLVSVDVAHYLEDKIDTKVNKSDVYTEYGGFNGGQGSVASYGGAIGASAVTQNGTSVGWNTWSIDGVAVGKNARGQNGVAVGVDATIGDIDSGTAIDAIQIGTGNNSDVGTLNVYNYKLMNSDGSIPEARLAQIISFDNNGNLSITINGVTKKFAPISE